jgi:hypothetical protein
MEEEGKRQNTSVTPSGDMAEKQSLDEHNCKVLPLHNRKNAVLWDVMPCGSCENRRFEERSASILSVERISELMFLRNIIQSLVDANGFPTSLSLSTLMMEAKCSSETSVLTRATRRHIPEDDILHSHRHESLKSYIALTGWILYRRSNIFPVRYELGFHIPEDAILHCHRRENIKCYIALTGWTLYRRSNVFPVRYELGFISQKTAFFIVTAVKTRNAT